MPRLYVSTRKGLFVLEPSQGRWKVAARHFLGEPVTAVLASESGRRLLAALRLGHFGVKLRLSEDGGGTWGELAAPTYPGKPEPSAGAPEDPHPWTLDLVWVLSGNHPAAPRRVWAGTIPGGLFRSDDGGSTWSLIESLWNMPERVRWFGGGYDYPGIHSICVHPADADDIVVGVSCGGAWRTRDGGRTWSAGRGMRAEFMPPERRDDPVIQDPHRIVQCEARPDELWTQHHCGIWRSFDRGATWAEVHGAQPTNFGFAVAVDPGDPARAWFAPAASDDRRVPVDGKVVVSLTRDGGANFELQHEGLPQGDAYHLVYRHGLAISGDGQWLALGSTTGGLWTQQRGSAHWIQVDAALPPIHAVEFAQ